MPFELRSAPAGALLSLKFGECEAVRVKRGPNGEDVEGDKVAPGSYPTALTVFINGKNVTEAIGGPFNGDVTYVDVKPYLVEGDNLLIFGSATPGRLQIQLDLLTESILQDPSGLRYVGEGTWPPKEGPFSDEEQN
ncbi:MAG TPA: hypothetical protein VNT01_01185 [Symbiobacteriaceae bacterium]|nr:hypothetical protein [Symbiobacteriaceae bacterium]